MKDCLELSKPRITFLVVLTALAGFIMASKNETDWTRLFWTLTGVALTAAATGCLNQVMEIKEDFLMRRTRNRPLPQGRLEPRTAFFFGLACSVFGGFILIWKVNAVSCILTACTLVSYLLIYTPLKRKTPLAVWIGAVPGAMPPLIGWAAAKGSIGLEAWILYGIQFLWQIPHFLALSWICREDYEKAGFCVLSTSDPKGLSTSRQIEATSWALVLLSLIPYAAGLAGPLYLLGAVGLGVFFILAGAGFEVSWDFSEAKARKVFRASLLYLPSLYGLIVASSR